jgi:2-phospho-L-lactate/phosphoenolpyruvate guanylyltransferase
VLPADLPLITAQDIREMLRVGDRHADTQTLVIATDRAGDGTNALYMNPLGMFPFAYGVGSFERHMQLARDAGARVEVVKNEHLSLDIDYPADLDTYRRIASVDLLLDDTAPSEGEQSAQGHAMDPA